MRVILDGMGGDNAPSAIAEGAVMAASKCDKEIVIVGDEAEISSSLKKHGYKGDRISIINAGEVIENEESPVQAVRKKKDSSLVKGISELLDNPEDIFISAGSTGALFVGARLILGRIRGIDRPALASVYPILEKKKHALIVDAGASTDCRPKNLLEYAVMGSIYVKNVMGIDNPRVGLVNVGTEEAKGSILTKSAYDLLQDADLNFVGNVEARDVPKGACDVIVCDGFVGNVILKLTEGLGWTILKLLKNLFYSGVKNKFAGLMLKGDLKNMKDEFDYSEYGGAPIIGVRGAVLKIHGSSGSRAVMNTIIKGIPFGEKRVVEKIEKDILKLDEGTL